jgi:hypothetical protein
MPEDKTEIRPQTTEEKRDNEENPGIPYFKMELDLTPEQIEKLTDDVFEEFEVLKAERDELKLREQWEDNEAQYEGIVPPMPRMKFNVSTKQSKVKVDAIVRAIREGFLDVDPKYAITPRPEETRQNAQEVSRNQADFLDYEIDENIKPEHAFTQVSYSAVKHYVGIQKIIWDYRREERKREEIYEGKNEPAGIDPRTGEVIFINKAVQEFINNHPETLDEEGNIVKNKTYIDRLNDEKNLELVVKYQETIANNAKLCDIDLEDFYVRNACDYNAGLATEHMIAERINYTWWELLDEENNGLFSNVEGLQVKDQKDTDDDEEGNEAKQNPEFAEYDVMEFTTYIRLSDSSDPVKIKAWFGEKSKQFLGAIHYPWYGIDCDYKGYWVQKSRKKNGFFGGGKGVMWDIRDSNIAQDAILNLNLQGVYARNILTPIVPEGSEIEKLILENRWTDGLPLPVSDDLEDVGKGVGFVQYPQQNTADMLTMVQFLKQQDGSITGVNEGISGQRDPTDPAAPASKTIALLRQSGINIQDYLREFEPSFSETASDILQMYYQMSKDAKKFKVGKRANDVAGSPVFQTLSREDMVAKTNIQARATAYQFDKVNEKRENLAMWQMMMSNPMMQVRPKTLYFAFLEVMKSWSPFWKNVADSIMPTPEEFSQEQAQAAVQGILQLAQASKAQEQATGVKPDIGLEQMIAAVTQSQVQSAGLGQEEERG